MVLALSIFVAAGLVLAVFYYWKRLEIEPIPGKSVTRNFFYWAGKSILLPLLVWLLINTDTFPGMPILLPQVASAQAAGESLVGPVCKAMAAAIFVVVSCWAGLALFWLLVKFYRLSENRRELWGVGAFWLCMLSPLALALFWVGGLAVAGLAAVVSLVPIVHLAASLVQSRKAVPIYSKATALLKMGKFNQAEWEVIQELEKCENDFEGWMMLAELYAVHFRDMSVAEQIIYDVCREAGTNASQICTAVYKLSDWHLKVGEDPESARRVLEVICNKWPGTHLDKMARFRIQQIPATREDLLQERQGRTIPLPALQGAEETRREPVAPLSKQEAARLANACVEKLKINPNNVAAREEFARLLAERLEKPALAIEQLELLLGMRHQSEQNRAEWMSLIAAFHFRQKRDSKAGQAVLRKLIEQYPESAQAFTAQRRLNLIFVEEKMRRSRLGIERTGEPLGMTNDRPDGNDNDQ